MELAWEPLLSCKQSELRHVTKKQNRIPKNILFLVKL